VFCVVLLLRDAGWLAIHVSAIVRALRRGDRPLGPPIGLGIMLRVVLFGGLAYVFILRGHGLARRLLREDATVEEPGEPDRQEVLLWIGFAICGVLVLVNASVAVARDLTTHFWLRRYPGWIAEIRQRHPALIVVETLRAAFGVYLLLGAPWLRKYIVRRMSAT